MGDAEMTTYLLELFQRTNGDPEMRVSMYDVGAALGLEKSAAGRLAEDLIAGGWAEIKSLSGAIGITAEGIAAAQAAGAVSEATPDGERLEKQAVLSTSGRSKVEQVVAAVKAALSGSSADYGRLEEIFIDIKTLEVQLLSPRPKTAILRECLAALQGGLDAAGTKELARRIGRFIAP